MTHSYRQILVHLDPTRSVTRRLATAMQVARQNEAALMALYAATPSFVELAYAPEIGSMIVPDLIDLDDRRRQRAIEVFDAAAAQPGANLRWSQTAEIPLSQAFALQAFYADLVVLGQPDRSDENARAVPVDFVEAVLAASGRPALVVPYVNTAGTMGETVAIAWKPSPEAARAVTAALPFLQRARQVHILTWGDEEPPAAGESRLDLTTYLRAHGIEATWHRGGPEPAAIGELLLSRVFDLGADLLVMGCYGHGRAREWILGGATRTVLASMIVPVLMAH
ncbi:MAG: universal stress protein [Ramlibacter sp.]